MARHNHPKALLVRIDPDLRDLLPGFLENRQLDIQQLHRAVAVGDFETIRTLGHRMRGDGGGYGFHFISDIGEALEKAAIEKHVSDISARIEDLVEYLDRIEVVYE